ncbi:MAG: FtsH protease activity modulator HflK [Alphaproteobacteria bacterium]
MSWNNQGGGGPWGGQGSGPWGRGPSGGGPPPPDLEDLLRKGQERFRRFVPGGVGGSRGVVTLLLLLVALWAATGFYRVETDEQGVVLRFGRYVYTTGPGLHYRLPSPIETVETPRVTVENRLEIGFRSVGEARNRSMSARDVLEESIMLTGDENIVDIDFTVIWDIKDAGNYLFNLRDPDGTVRVAAESAMREVLGQTQIQVALTEGRQKIEQRTLETLQRLLEEYQTGIRVKRVQLLKVDPPGEVVDAFNDVQRARADRERLRNEAEAYRNGIIPVARGDAERLSQEAQAYREEIVNRAQGDANRFDAVLMAYSKARDVTMRRLYLETMEEVLRNANKVVMDARSLQGVQPYLPLPELKPRPGTSPAASGTSGGGRASGQTSQSGTPQSSQSGGEVSR